MNQSGGNHHHKKHKTVRGTKNQKRPSASYYYKVLGKSVGYKTSYRPRKGGKMIKYSLQLRKNGSPYWKALTRLPKKTKKKKSQRGGAKLTQDNLNTIKEDFSKHDDMVDKFTTDVFNIDSWVKKNGGMEVLNEMPSSDAFSLAENIRENHPSMSKQQILADYWVKVAEALKEKENLAVKGKGGGGRQEKKSSRRGGKRRKNKTARRS